MKNVKTDYAAVGDGATDDTTALQTALDAVGTGGAAAGQQLLFPAGTYKITSPLVLNRVGNYNLLGEGPLASVVSFSGGPNAGACIQGKGDTTNYADITIEKLGFTAATPGNLAYGFASNGSGTWARLRFTSCKFSNFYGCGIRWAQAVDATVIDRCEFTANGLSSYASAITSASDIAGGMSNSQITNCHFHDTGYNNLNSHSIYINGVGKNVTIANCRFVACAQNEISLDGSGGGQALFYGCVVTGCTFTQSPLYDAINVTNVTGTTITGNAFQSTKGATVTVAVGCNGYIVSGNTFTSNGTGTDSKGGTSVTVAYTSLGGVISGNTFASYDGVCNGPAILCQAGGDSVVSGNTIINYDVGIGLWNQNAGSGGSYRWRIFGNSISTLPGAVSLGGFSPFIPTGTFAAIQVNGIAVDTVITDNSISGMTYGLYLTNQNADSGTPTNTVFARNRITRMPDATGAGVFVKSGVKVVNLAVDNNLGRSDVVATGATVTNLRRVNNSLDGSYFTAPGTVGQTTTL